MQFHPLLPSVPERPTQRLHSIMADSKKQQLGYLQSAPISAFCSVQPQKSSYSECIQRFKSIMAHSKKLLGFLPPVCTSDPVTKIQWLSAGLASWKDKIPSFQSTPGRGEISTCATQGLSSLWLTVQSLSTGLSSTFSLSLALLLEKRCLTFVAQQLSFPSFHGLESRICHVLSLQLCRLFS